MMRRKGMITLKRPLVVHGANVRYGVVSACVRMS